MPKKITLSPEIAADYAFVGNTFVSKDKEPEVEVGDIMVANAFEPQVKLKRWGNEANFSVRLSDTTPGQADVTVDKEKVVWAKGDREAHFYAQGWGVDNGAFEFEVVLLSKPSSNVIAFTFQSKELEFWFQPPLTQEELDAGTIRPDNVVGSYAVYHTSRGNTHPNQADAERYKAGKAFHIYRPKLIDALGDEIWADLDIDVQAGMMTVTVDQAWLDSATYPVILDPNFGYETIGGTAPGLTENDLYGLNATAPSDAATADSITFYSVADTLDGNAKGVLVLHSTLAIVTNGVGGATAESNTASWNTSTFGTSPTLSPSTDYVIMWIHDGSGLSFNHRLYYDTGGGNQAHYDLTNSYSSPTDPTGATHQNRQYSIYCTYTAAAVGQPTQIRTQGTPTGSGYRARPGAWN
jgi:hypothetical protein